MRPSPLRLGGSGWGYGDGGYGERGGGDNERRHGRGGERERGLERVTPRPSYTVAVSGDGLAPGASIGRSSAVLSARPAR